MLWAEFGSWPSCKIPGDSEHNSDQGLISGHTGSDTKQRTASISYQRSLSLQPIDQDESRLLCMQMSCLQQRTHRRVDETASTSEI